MRTDQAGLRQKIAKQTPSEAFLKQLCSFPCIGNLHRDGESVVFHQLKLIAPEKWAGINIECFTS